MKAIQYLLLITLLIHPLSTLFFEPAIAADTIPVTSPDSSSSVLRELIDNVNIVWVLLCAALVFFMQAGFMCLECGLASAKNSINIAIKNLSDFVIATIGFWLVGFALMFGITQYGLFGASDFFISIDNSWRAIFFVFQTVFAGTAATIVSGAISGRTRFVGYLLVSLVISICIYPIFGHWAWGSFLYGNEGGWLERYFHFKDFAGSTVVHSVGAWVALAALIVIGPRIGKYNEDGSANSIPPHNMTLVYLGTLILFFGWFGFNCGSTLAVSEDIAPIALNTLLSAAFGSLSCSLLSWTTSEFKRPEGEMVANGLLGGLVGITAGCAFVDTWAAALIGVISGGLTYFGAGFIERRLKLDDVVGAVAVHGLCGAWGTIATGIFIRADLLGSITRLEQIFGQVVGVTACFFWTFTIAYTALKTIDYFVGLRVSEEDEIRGLNVSEHGAKSTLLDLATSMHIATETNDFSDRRKIEAEPYTELGDLVSSFNTMLDVVQRSLLESKIQQSTAESHAQASRQALAETEKEKQRAEELMRTTLESESNLKSAMENIESSKLEAEKQKERIHATAREAQQVSHATEVEIDRIAQSADTLKHTLAELQNRSDDIDAIIDTIQKISDQTGLLALNAKIEASRAGISGKGFSVIAEEIGQLSKESKNASVEIRETLEKIAGELVILMQKSSRQQEMVLDGKHNFCKLHELISNLVEKDKENDSPLMSLAA